MNFIEIKRRLMDILQDTPNGYGMIRLFDKIVEACNNDIDKAIEFAVSKYGGLTISDVNKILDNKKENKDRYQKSIQRGI